MKRRLFRLLEIAAPVLDLFCSPLTILGGFWLKLIRQLGVHRMPVSRSLLDRIGVFPIRDHYHEPLFKTTRLIKSLREDRSLPGLDLNIEEQLAVLAGFDYGSELLRFPAESDGRTDFYYHNGAYEAGDAEYLYSMIRCFKPRRLIEIGSGYSTLISRWAIGENHRERQDYKCDHICIEPFEQPGLELLPVQVIRRPVEQCGMELFETMEANDILFVDSSHIIRPQGDVLYIFLELLPRLQPGVLVQLHDIFTPKDYRDEWIIAMRRFWNEQYLLEAFLSCNRRFRVLGALNYLAHHHPEALGSCCPVWDREREFCQPGAFWLVKHD